VGVVCASKEGKMRKEKEEKGKMKKGDRKTVQSTVHGQRAQSNLFFAAQLSLLVFALVFFVLLHIPQTHI